jgi:hypothetical protein
MTPAEGALNPVEYAPNRGQAAPGQYFPAVSIGKPQLRAAVPGFRGEG